MANEKDRAATTGTWLDLGMEILKAIAESADEAKKATEEAGRASVPVKPDETRIFAHYVAYNGHHLLALVIGQDEDRGHHQADLAVFTNLKNAAGKKNFGLQFHQDVTYGEAKVPGTWHWIEE